jgi:DNA-binding CsgD family transcriptional regulator
LRRATSTTVDWRALTAREHSVLSMVAAGAAQKVVAIKLRMAPSTVSAALGSARRRLGFPSFGRLVRAFCAAAIP